MNIKQYRLILGLSQKELGIKLGVSQKAVSKWETGKSFPKSELLPVIASIFNCKIEDLY